MKRLGLITIIAATFSLPIISSAQNTEFYLGKPNAPVTVIEYGSLTCSHCAHFANQEFPKLKAQYIDTGKVKYIFRPLPTPPENLSAGMQVIADCEGGMKRYQLIDAFFKNQALIFRSAQSPGGALAYLTSVANQTTGINSDKIKACLADPSKITAIQNSENGAVKLGINSTPTILIDGKIVKLAPTQELDFNAIKPGIDHALLAKAKKRK